MENINTGSVIILSLQFLRSFGGFSNVQSAGFWGSAPDPDGGASSAPPYPLAGREGCPAPSPGQLRLPSAPPLFNPLPLSPPPPPQPTRLDPLVSYVYGCSNFQCSTLATAIKFIHSCRQAAIVAFFYIR